MSQNYSISAIFRAVDKMSPAMKRMGANMSRFGKQSRSVGRGMTAGLSAPIAAFGALTLKTAVNFEASMNKVEALSGSTGKSLEKMRDMAKDLGSSTAFSASQAADAMGFLSMAGWDANQVLAGTPAILNLAAASGTDLARSADIASNIMGQFKIGAEGAGRVADVLAAATSSANVDMEMLAESFKYAGPVAKTFGMSLEETAAAIGLLGNVGIQGSTAGTALKNSMLQLVSPASDASKMMKKLGVDTQDAQGNLLPFSDIISSFGGKIKDLGNGTQLKAIEMLFGKISLAGATELISQAQNGQLQKFAKNLSNVEGRAESMAKTINKGAPGAVKSLTSAFEGMMIAISEAGLLQWFTDAAKGLTVFIRDIAKASPELLKWGTIIAGAVIVAGPLLIILGMAATGFGVLAGAVTAVSLPVLAIVAALALVAVGAYLLWDNWDKITGWMSESFQFLTTEIVNIWDGVVAYFSSAWGTISGIFSKALDGIIGFFTDKFASVSAAFDEGVIQGIGKLVAEFNPFSLWFDTLDGLVAYFTGFDLSGIMAEKMASMASGLPDWAKNLLNIGELSAEQPAQQINRTAEVVRGSGGGARDARARVDVNIAGAPPGTRVNSETSGDGLDFDLGVGYAR